MKQIAILLTALLLGGSLSAQSKKALVVYFSATGKTEAAAKILAEAAQADLMAIVPETAYTQADLDWNNRSSRSSLEMRDEKSRPAIKPLEKKMADYETIYIGFPIWWGVAPRIVNTAIEAAGDLKGKTIRIFATSGSSTIDGSLAALKKTYPDLNIKDGRTLNKGKEDVDSWLK